MNSKTRLDPKESCDDDLSELEEESSFGEEREPRTYYYDDAHGYEEFDPESEVDDTGDEGN